MSEIASKFKRLLERFLGCLVPPKRVRGQTKVESGGEDARAVAHLPAQATTLVRERESHLEFPQLESEVCPVIHGDGKTLLVSQLAEESFCLRQKLCALAEVALCKRDIPE